MMAVVSHDENQSFSLSPLQQVPSLCSPNNQAIAVYKLSVKPVSKMRLISAVFLAVAASRSDAFAPLLDRATKSISSLRMSSDDEVVLNKYSR